MLAQFAKIKLFIKKGHENMFILESNCLLYDLLIMLCQELIKNFGSFSQNFFG